MIQKDETRTCTTPITRKQFLMFFGNRKAELEAKSIAIPKDPRTTGPNRKPNRIDRTTGKVTMPVSAIVHLFLPLSKDFINQNLSFLPQYSMRCSDMIIEYMPNFVNIFAKTKTIPSVSTRDGFCFLPYLRNNKFKEIFSTPPINPDIIVDIPPCIPRFFYGPPNNSTERSGLLSPFNLPSR